MNRQLENRQDKDSMNSLEENNIILNNNRTLAPKLISEDNMGNKLFPNSIDDLYLNEQISKFMSENENMNNVTNDVLVLNYVKKLCE